MLKQHGEEIHEEILGEEKGKRPSGQMTSPELLSEWKLRKRRIPSHVEVC